MIKFDQEEPPRLLRRPTLLLQRSKNAEAGGFFSSSRERLGSAKCVKNGTPFAVYCGIAFL
jgi:hypothetical protein